MDNVFALQLLGGASIIGAAAFFLAMRESRAFDRRYAKAHRPAAKRDGAERLD